ncbi:MAG: phosphoribosylformylglycinamidine cyclo-ligase [Candidatus Burarchaeum sp.]|nr:phosphoribosylformylglycinamidine cyclo-ligase [Candidatus Burarchaeum sp.]MDO8339328.1 phosphoribosylformylglycinamidine cyclo-ligase [Candidatus Burarchaeum sp.]
MAFDYSKAGVDVQKVKDMHAQIDEMLRATHSKDVLPIYGHYAGLLKLPGGKQLLAIHTDGVGTKVLVAQRLRKFDTVGIDCVAMNVNDILCVGARPTALVDYLALEREDSALTAELMKGLVKGAKEAGVSIVGGETAIMGDVIKGEPGCTGFDLAATCIGTVETKDGKPITGEAMKAGDVVVGLESSGIHSNALTLARKVLTEEKWQRELLTPTRIYVKPVLEMVAKLEVHGLAHITGGAFSKLSRIADRAKVGITLENMPSPQPLFAEIQRVAKLSEREMYRTFNMGVGMCVVVPEKDADACISIAKRHEIKASRIGKVTKEKGILLRKERLD